MTTENPTQVTEDEEKQESRLDELYQKKDNLSEDEKREFDSLKTERKNRYQKRLDKIKSEALAAKHEAETERQRREEAEKKLEAREKQRRSISSQSFEEYMEIGGKQYLTDRALKALVEAGEISDEEAWTRKEERDEERRVERVRERLKNEDEQEKMKRERAEDMDIVLRKYPQFNKNHPDFDPENPLYKETNRLWQSGYQYNPRGLSEAVRDAKRILRISDDMPDTSDSVSLRSSLPSASNGRERHEVEMSESEREYVINLYKNKINPKTGKTYTSDEAVARAKKAKEAQLAGRKV